MKKNPKKSNDSDYAIPQETASSNLLRSEQIELKELRRAVRLISMAIISRDATSIAKAAKIAYQLTRDVSSEDNDHDS